MFIKDRGLGKKKPWTWATENREDPLKKTKESTKAEDEESHIPVHKFTILAHSLFNVEDETLKVVGLFEDMQLMGKVKYSTKLIWLI